MAEEAKMALLLFSTGILTIAIGIIYNYFNDKN
jgi:hypothetical protein